MFTAFDSDFEPFFRSIGFQGVMQNSKKRATGHPTGNATFYRTSKFSLDWEDHRSRALIVGLRPINTEGEGTSNVSIEKQDSSSSHDDASGQVAATKMINRRVYVANVHLEGHYTCHDKRFEQLQSLIKQLEKQGVGKDDQASCVICGDFNHRLHGSLASVLLEGRIDAGYEQEGVVVTKKMFAHGIQMRSAYSPTDNTPTYIRPDHCWHRIDHILLSPCNLFCEATLEIIPDADREEVLRTSLPNHKYPSDHMAIGAVLRWL